jgi:uncharacterized membrane protein YtjA (UPF0391 family)
LCVVCSEFWAAFFRTRNDYRKDNAMLKWAIIFLVISLVAGVFGFTGISAAAATVSRALFAIALILFLIFLLLAIFGVGLTI